MIASPRMNTTSSRNQFKAIRIGENLVVNYNKVKDYAENNRPYLH